MGKKNTISITENEGSRKPKAIWNDDLVAILVLHLYVQGGKALLMIVEYSYQLYVILNQIFPNLKMENITWWMPDTRK
ncbi:hypothetical protein EZV62_002143 [Acer yangbiense]|uniref:Uncharacterized protein n=1 Tax=Acer yangbiense TaxID=1000413 RepID=A0A5C7IXC0_9ROSI|nr:hypothetical protein EZV62_002143 [Acer yangbiense]